MAEAYSAFKMRPKKFKKNCIAFLGALLHVTSAKSNKKMMKCLHRHLVKYLVRRDFDKDEKN